MSTPVTATSPAPFLIIETGQPVPAMKRYGSFPHWIRVAAGLAAAETVVANVERGERLPSRHGFAGAIVTGSAAMVTDRADWSERSADWLRDAAGEGLPLLGICYGHQLLVHALGGEVADNPAGRESGTVAIDLHPQAADDPLFAGFPPRFAAQATHVQTVLRPPEGAAVLACSEQIIAMLSAGANAPGGCSSIPSSPPATCAAMCGRGPSICTARAVARARFSARSAPRHRRVGCCGDSSAMRDGWPIPDRTGIQPEKRR